MKYNYTMFADSVKRLVNKMYLLTKWEGRMGKYLARGHGLQTERSEVRAPFRMGKYLTESQIFSYLARPNIANKFFII